MSDETKELTHSLVSVCQEHRDRVLSLYARDEQQARDLAAPWIRKHHCDASQVTVTAKPEGSSSLPGKIPLRDMSQLSLVASVSSGGRCSGGTMIEQHREMARLRAQVEEEHAGPCTTLPQAQHVTSSCMLAWTGWARSQQNTTNALSNLVTINIRSRGAMMSDEQILTLQLMTVIREQRAYHTLVYARDANHARRLAASWIRQQQCNPAAVQVQAYPQGFSTGRTYFHGHHREESNG
ncbi:MAG: hypothetical protein J2P36_00385 [Ktedonobacteraceae bacterium]|nr:hypothetical protein [Ktedonobacteraceae bacterium]